MLSLVDLELEVHLVHVGWNGDYFLKELALLEEDRLGEERVALLDGEALDLG